MKLLSAALVALIVLIQYPLWLGKGGWLRVWALESQIGEQKAANQRLEARNAALQAEVGDLKDGFEAIEERARSELGMIRSDEVFFQVMASPAAPARQAGR